MYLDSAILIKLIVREPDSLYYAEQLDGQVGLWSSELALTEVWSALLRKEREQAIDESTRRTAWQALQRHVNSDLNLLPADRDLLHRANRVLEQCHPDVALRSLDAIHLASCEVLDAFPLWTNDARMRAAATCLHFPLCPLP